MFKDMMTQGIPSNIKSPCRRERRMPGDQRIAQCLKNHKRLFFNHFCKEYISSHSKDSKLIKDLITKLDREYNDKERALQEILNLQEHFFVVKDDWILRSGYTVGIFISNINKIKAWKKIKGNKIKQAKKQIISTLYCS